jgi:hypothetical protein
MDESTLREQLHRMASEVGTHDALERRTIGRARRRRVVNAAATVAIVAGLVAGGFAGARAILDQRPTVANPPTPTPSPTPSADVTGIPPEVATTAQGIFKGATARDLDALAALLDPNTFDYDFNPGANPIPEWRQDPSVFDLMIAVLRLPPTSRDIEGNGMFYFWPYLVNSDFAALSEQERADLRSLGFTDPDIELMVEAGHGYQGPRLAIDETAVWRSFLTVGE